LCDDDFISYVLDRDTSTVSRWEAYIIAPYRAHHAFLTACDILMHLDDCSLLSSEEAGRLKERIFLSLRKKS